MSGTIPSLPAEEARGVPSENELASGLAAAGLPLVAAPNLAVARPANVSRLAQALAAHENPLLRLALVPLLLTNPSVETAPGPIFGHLYTAAVSLQRRWRTRLRLLGCETPLPDLYSRQLHLPDPSANYGEPCLREILERFEDGRAGARIRGAGTILDKLLHETFELLSREAVSHAPPR